MGNNRLTGRMSGMLLFLFMLAGCATGPTKTERFFWPPLPDVPRIEWLGAYSNMNDLKKPGMMAALLGEEEVEGLQSPVYIGADGNGKVYVSDMKRPGFLVFDLKALTIHALGGDKALELFQRPTGVAIDADGNIYAADTGYKKIVVFDRNEVMQKVFDLSKDVKSIASIAIDKSRKRLIVPDVSGHKIMVYDLSGNQLMTVGKRGLEDGELNFPTSVAIDREGEMIVCDSQNARIQIFSPEGKFVSKFGRRGDNLGDFNIIKAASVDSEGHIYVTDGKAHRITILSKQGEVLLVFGGAFSLKPGGTIAPGGFLLPNGIYIDDNDTIYAVDQMNSRFQVFQYMNDKYMKEKPVAGLPAPAAAKPAGK